MAIHDLYSKRQKRLRGETPDVFVYDDIPKTLRVQIIHIWTDMLGRQDQYEDALRQALHGRRMLGVDERMEFALQAYNTIADILCHEYGLFKLCEPRRGLRGDRFRELTQWFQEEKEIDRVLDAIQLSLDYIDKVLRTDDYFSAEEAGRFADEAIEEANIRFKEHGVGYEFVEGKIKRIDSAYVHAEAVRPVLSLLSKKMYAGADEEFRTAHEHYRHGRMKEAITWAGKALESTLKAICSKQGWEFSENDTTKPLLDICFSHELIPEFWQNKMAGLRSLLEGGVPTARNRRGGHGQGAEPQSVPDHMAAYVMHMTASCILFLARGEEQL